MQCHQPLFGIGYPTPGQCPPVYPFNGVASDIIGEGEVTAVTFPDGTIQYYFLPVRWNGSEYYAKRWPPYPFTDSYCNSYNRPSSGAWIITKISNTFSPVFNHCFQRTNPDPFHNPCFNYDCNVNIPPGFQLKFHNDCCSSTTDLHYFCPTVWKPVVVATTRSASVQVETPTEAKCSRHNVDSKVPCNSAPCACSSTKQYNNKRIQCKCKQIEKKPSSHMSIDKSKTSSSSCNIKKSKSKKKKHEKSCSSSSSCIESNRATKKRRKLICGCDSQRNSVNKADIASNDQKQPAKKDGEIICECALHNTDVDGQRLSKKKKSQMDCYCEAQSIADKTVVTYTDQASSVKEVEGQTQTAQCLNCSCSTLDVNQVSVNKLWIPKRIRDAQSLEKIVGVYETSSSESNKSSSSCRTSRSSF